MVYAVIFSPKHFIMLIYDRISFASVISRNSHPSLHSKKGGTIFGTTDLIKTSDGPDLQETKRCPVSLALGVVVSGTGWPRKKAHN